MSDADLDYPFKSDDELAKHVESELEGSDGPLGFNSSIDTNQFPDTLDELCEDIWGGYRGCIRLENDDISNELDRAKCYAEYYDTSVEDVIDKIRDVEGERVTHKPLHRRDSSVLEFFANETDYTVEEISDFLNLSETTVENYLQEYDLSLTDVEMWGDKVSWTRQSRKIREMDGYECVSCGMISEEQQDEFGTELPVHHIIPKQFLEAEENKHATENLVTLCSRCHKEWEHLTPRELFKRAVES